MKDILDKCDVVLDANDPGFVEKLTDALGGVEGEDYKYEIVTPQFERTKNMPPVKPPPEDFEALKGMTAEELKALGCGNWDGGLMMLPGEWYDHIPEGFEMEDIFGEKEIFKRGMSDDDIRFGCLSYGVRIGPPTDDLDE